MATYITGDKHGSVQQYQDAINSIENPTVDDVIIVCGDAGLEYGTYIMGDCKKTMSNFPGQWIILRGNHDNRYWRDHVTNGTPHDGWSISTKFNSQTLVQDKYPNIHYLLDGGGFYHINGYNYLMIPGAFSVDGQYRIINRLPYEFDEQLFDIEKVNLENIVNTYLDHIDFVCGHTFPISLEGQLRYLFLDFIDQNKVDKAMERFIEKIMWQVEKGKSFKQYFGGHYHDNKKLSKDYTMLIDGMVEIEELYG